MDNMRYHGKCRNGFRGARGGLQRCASGFEFASFSFALGLGALGLGKCGGGKIGDYRVPIMPLRVHPITAIPLATTHAKPTLDAGTGRSKLITWQN
jgi:hypothetical protein